MNAILRRVEGLHAIPQPLQGSNLQSLERLKDCVHTILQPFDGLQQMTSFNYSEDHIVL